jgi:hypothetical protein
MKLNKFLLATASAIAIGTSASHAATINTTLTVTGSTAFRKVAFDRAPTILSGAMTVKYSGALGNSYQSYIGTVTGHPEYGNVLISFSFNGSLEGIDALNNNTALTVLDVSGVTYVAGGSTTIGATTTASGDLAFSDVFTATAGRSSAKFTGDNQVGVVPYLICRAPLAFDANSNALGALTNITQRQLAYLYGSDGVLPVGFLTGGSNPDDANPAYVVGRYSLSGTRAVTEKTMYSSALNVNYYWNTHSNSPSTGTSAWAFGENPSYETNGVPSYALDNSGLVSGFLNGGDLKTNLAIFPDALGYLGIADVASNTKLAYEGITESQSTVENGQYPIWSYEHAYYKTTGNGGPSGNPLAILTSLLGAIESDAYQTNTGLLYFTSGFVPLSAMNCSRTVDGGPITQ